MTHNPYQAHWFDGVHEHGTCICGNDCSTHPDAANPLSGCGDCGADTCPDCRVEDNAQRCNDCAAKFYATPADPARCAVCGQFLGDYGCVTLGCDGQ